MLHLRKTRPDSKQDDLIEDLKNRLIHYEQENKELQFQVAQMQEHNKRIKQVRGMAHAVSWETNILTGRLIISGTDDNSILPPQYHSLTFDDLIEHIHSDDRIKFKTTYEQSLKDGKSFEITHRIISASGEERIVAHYCMNFMATNGMPCKATGLIQEVTDRILNEEKLKSFAKELERSNFELQEFASIASHDLQEPLRKICTFGDRLKQKSQNIDKETISYIDRIQSATIRMKELIEDLLCYSRVTTRPAPFRHVKLKNIIKDSLLNLEDRLAETKGKVNIDGALTLDADSFQMRQLFQNLIGNSLKYHKVGVSPVINIHSQHSGNEKAIITIEDNGIGFNEKYSQNIFQPFQRLHGKSDYDGTGIGLAICKKIVVRHKGTISVKSTPGKGSKFIVTLPVKQT